MWSSAYNPNFYLKPKLDQRNIYAGFILDAFLLSC